MREIGGGGPHINISIHTADATALLLGAALGADQRCKTRAMASTYFLASLGLAFASLAVNLGGLAALQAQCGDNPLWAVYLWGGASPNATCGTAFRPTW